MILLIFVISLLLRLVNLNQSLWLDEAINVVYSQKYNFIDFLTVYSLGDFHPPLYFGILWIWTRIFGISEIAVRIPSVIFGVLTVWLTFLIGKNLFNRKVGLIGTLILAFNPLHVYYSQEARMYSLAAFSVTFSFWALFNLLKGKKYFTLIYALSIILVLYSDYPAYSAILAQVISIVWLEREKFLKIFRSLILGGIFWLPWLAVFPTQFKTGTGAAAQIPGWANVVGGANFKELALLWVKSIIGRISFENKTLYAFNIGIISLLYGLIIFKALNPLKKEVKFLLCWIILPTFLLFIVSFYIPVFAYFRMIFILPGIALLLALGIDKFKAKNQRILLLSLIGINLVGLFVYYLDPKFQREDWRGAINFIISQNRPGKLILFEDNNIPAPFEYYFPCLHGKCVPREAGLKNFPAKSTSDLSDLDNTLIESRNVIYLFDYLVEISDPKRLLSRKLKDLGFKLKNTHNFHGVGFVYEYSK